ncbi:HD domain-containing protein [Orientia tsutsugamushi]|uniref:HD domain protein n=1 Tax=Orientia tsutsugamushi str. TA716 TaxID=1359175 RepID=A0A0F3NQ09_ORITS|nr:HD domain-containing protein [Orientia tsutsugamushi]KJV70113.1 HD domain protein [Orientia tsutsugamushi str. TA716]KJV72846.1 HD domain protein [Orientia tsutsugamushi str. TA716]KJV74210.1 HD domain protein [Orientia tsutsugamushi str. TA716]
MIDFYSESLLNKLFETNVRFNTEIDLDKVEKAIFYAQKYHGQQKRDTVELYYTHPLEVAHMVSDHSFKTDTIITAILHDTSEDTRLTKERISYEFGNNITEQVSDLTRIKDNKKISSREMIQTFYRQNKTELLLIKLFDRFHNIQTVSIKPYEKRQEIILETQQEFIPLAEYLKLPEIAIELNKYCELYAT